MTTHGKIMSRSSKPAPPLPPPTPKRRPANWTARKRLRQVVEDWRAAEIVVANQRLRLDCLAKRIAQLETRNYHLENENRNLTLDLQAARMAAARQSAENSGLLARVAEAENRAARGER